MTPQALLPDAPAFDDVASAYDATFTASALGRYLRALTWERLDVALAAPAEFSRSAAAPAKTPFASRSAAPTCSPRTRRRRCCE